MNLRLTFNPPMESLADKFRRLATNGIYEGIARVAGDVDELFLAALGAEAPKRTGEYASRIHSVQFAHYGGGISLEYRAPDPLSSWIIEGTAPHSIDPVNATVLRFLAADGQVVFAHHVDHPGTAPNDYPRRAWESVRGDVAEIWSRVGRNIWDEVA